MASYTKVAKNNWQVVISLGYGPDGKKKRIKKQGFKLKSDAEKFTAEILQRKNEGYLKVDTKRSFESIFTEWFEVYKKPQLSLHSIDYYTRTMENHIMPYFGQYRLNEIDNCLVQQFYNNMIKEKNLSSSSAQKIVTFLSTFFKYAKKNKFIYEMPTDIERVPVVHRKMLCWNKTEVDFFLDKISDSNMFKPVFIDVLTGLRIGELCGLRWCDIHLDKSIMNVNNQVIYDSQSGQLLLSSTLKTPSSKRTIVMPVILLNYLKNIKEEEKPSSNDFVIKNKNGEMENPHNLSKRFTRAVKKYKDSFEDKREKDPTTDEHDYMQLSQITFHGLRHTHATLLLANKENVKVVSERLGHKGINMTLNTYTHVLDEMRVKSAETLDNIFDK